MICKECHNEGQRSTVRSNGSRRTLLSCAPTWDEDGVYHLHDSNVTTTSYTCSRGHSWTEQTKATCPAPDCEWNKR